MLVILEQLLGRAIREADAPRAVEGDERMRNQVQE